MNQAVIFLLTLSGTLSIGSSSVSWQYYYVTQSMSWSDAQTYCRTNYIDMVTVGNLNEQNSVLALTTAAGPGYNGPVWLGLRRTWTWITGEPHEGQFPFNAEEPNEGNDEAACGVIESTGLKDWFCSTLHEFVCYDDSPYATSEFVPVQLSLNWTNAEAYCRENYAQLATIKTSQDQERVMSLLSTDAFIGLISAQWSDNRLATYRYWTGISNLETSQINECVAMVISDSGKWNTFDCTIQNPFICYGAPPVQSPISRLYHAVKYLRTWPDAQRYCRLRFTDLATVPSMGDVSSMVNQVDPTYIGLLWIGLQSVTSTRWCWSMGDEALFNYYNWAAGYPNGTGQCVSFVNGLWKDTDCQTILYFVCYSEGRGYIKVLLGKTWQDAQSYCRSTYTDLARIRSDWEQNQVSTVNGRLHTVWIGLFLDNWQWSDQWNRPFRNWALGPPNIGTGNCGAVVAGTSGRWMTDTCTALHPFVCYGDVDKMIKRQVIRLKVLSKETTNLNDPSVQAAVLYKIGQKMKVNGITQNVRLSWRVWGDGSVFKKPGVFVSLMAGFMYIY